jgi:hypothetical protein
MLAYCAGISQLHSCLLMSLLLALNCCCRLPEAEIECVNYQQVLRCQGPTITVVQLCSRSSSAQALITPVKCETYAENCQPSCYSRGLAEKMARSTLLLAGAAAGWCVQVSSLFAGTPVSKPAAFSLISGNCCTILDAALAIPAHSDVHSEWWCSPACRPACLRVWQRHTLL